MTIENILDCKIQEKKYPNMNKTVDKNVKIETESE